jgi:hypothetical protein
LAQRADPWIDQAFLWQAEEPMTEDLPALFLVEIDGVVSGSLDERTGAVTFGDAGPARYGVLDEIARDVWLAGGRVLAVRHDDVPRSARVAAITRYAPALS